MEPVLSRAAKECMNEVNGSKVYLRKADLRRSQLDEKLEQVSVCWKDAKWYVQAPQSWLRNLLILSIYSHKTFQTQESV